MATAKAKAPAKRKATKTRARKAASKQTQYDPGIDVGPELYDSPRWAKLVETYISLKDLGLPIPSDLAKPVEEWIEKQVKAEEAVLEAGDAEAKAIAKADTEGPKWVRNLYNSPFSLRLQRQDKKQRIELKPRGVRGDMHPLEPGDENDHVLINNLGFVEVIGDGTAKKVAEGQTHNIQKTNSTLALITNELGEPIKKLTVETEYNQQGVVVGYVDPNLHAKLEQGEFGRSKSALGDLVRQQPEQVSQFIPTGGNPAIVSQGPLTDNARAAVADKLARLKGVQGRPEEVLGLTVSVEPTRSA
jgi:hypothetical protein